MSDASNAKPRSHPIAWTGLLAGLVLLYFLSVPWVTVLTHRHRSLDFWVKGYAAPFDYVLHHSPPAIQHPIGQYYGWCWGKMGVAY